MITEKKSLWEKYIDISIGCIMILLIVYAFSATFKSCSLDLNRDRVLCEKYSYTIEEYDNCIAKRARVRR
jgi:hypothetical protein